MGMEGKLRQISEFELAFCRKTPAKLYSEILAQYEFADISQLSSAMSQLKNSPAAQRIQLMKLAGVHPRQTTWMLFFSSRKRYCARIREPWMISSRT
jgi:hypothetical protein